MRDSFDSLYGVLIRIRYYMKLSNRIILLLSLSPYLCLTACSGGPNRLQMQLTKKFSPSHLNSFLVNNTQALIKAFGLPQRRFVAGNQTYLVFAYNIHFQVMEQTGYASSWGWSPNAYGPGKYGYQQGNNGYNFYSYVPVTETCQITFTLVGGVAIHWTRQGSASWCGGSGMGVPNN